LKIHRRHGADEPEMKAKTRLHARCGFVLALASFSSWVVPAAAAGRPASSSAASAGRAAARAAELNERGLERYGAGDYRHALENFIEAHALGGDPNAVFNIARCYEKLDERDAALEKYQLFVATPGADAAGVERARTSIADLELASNASSAGVDRASPAAAEPSLPRANTSWVAEAHWLPWLTLGGSTVFLAAGSSVYALGVRDHAKVTDQRGYGNLDVPVSMTWKQASHLVHAGDTKKLLGGIGLGLGGALGAAALTLFLSESHSEAKQPLLAVEPAALPGGGALSVAGRFR
jgi:tetratricopeptide (TPR) repeat protein